jgi:hypothetical protein
MLVRMIRAGRWRNHQEKIFASFSVDGFTGPDIQFTRLVQARFSLADRSVFFVVTVRQTQLDPVFTDPITVRITSGEHTEVTTIAPTTKIALVLFHHASAPTSIEIDPDERLLKEVIKK